VNSNNLAAALRTWAGSAPDSLFSEEPWIIACWQAPEGDLSISGLLAATYALDADEPAPVPPVRRSQPYGWRTPSTSRPASSTS
jgi:hypothetical protein